MKARKPKKVPAGKVPAERKPRLGDWISRPDGSVAQYVREEDDEQRPADHFRTVDTLGLMLKNGTVTPQMFDAGQQFSQEFYAAQICGPRALKLERIGGHGTGNTMTEHSAYAHKKVSQALDAVGGISSPAGSALWYVAGLGMSVREWALRDGWNGKSLDKAEAKGILVAALGVLARYYGYERGPRGKRSEPRVLSDTTS